MSIYKTPVSRKVFNIFNVLLMMLLSMITLYPLLYTFAASISEPSYLLQGKISVIPKGFSIDAYIKVFQYPFFVRAYANTILYTVSGTAVNLLMTVMGAYALSRERLPFKNFFMFMVTFTMFFGGGMIPTFLLVKSLGLYNTIWAIIVPGAISTWNLIVLRSFFQQLPVSLEEAALIDGCNEFRILFSIFIPLSVPAMMTIGLFYAVAHWNGFFSALIYLKDKELYPLQLILRDIVISNNTDRLLSAVMSQDKELVGESIKFATIIVAILPIVIVYPFIQKYFVSGIMIGSIKG